jgi:NAD(P)H-dependent nitrite reductase small subunit
MTVDQHADARTAAAVGVTEAIEVCRLDDLSTERGAAALVGGVQVALFRTFDDVVYAVQQRDPYSGANVMSRGIVGSRGEIPTVASPMYKQVFDLRTGECLDPVGKDPRPLISYPVLVSDGAVLVTGAVVTALTGAVGAVGAVGDVAGAGP